MQCYFIKFALSKKKWTSSQNQQQLWQCHGLGFAGSQQTKMHRPGGVVCAAIFVCQFRMILSPKKYAINCLDFRTILSPIKKSAICLDNLFFSTKKKGFLTPDPNSISGPRGFAVPFFSAAKRKALFLLLLGGHFSISHVQFFGVWKGKSFVSKGVWKDKNFVSKGVWKGKNFVKKCVYHGAFFVKNTIFHAADQWKYLFLVCFLHCVVYFVSFRNRLFFSSRGGKKIIGLFPLEMHRIILVIIEQLIALTNMPLLVDPWTTLATRGIFGNCLRRSPDHGTLDVVVVVVLGVLGGE